MGKRWIMVAALALAPGVAWAQTLLPLLSAPGQLSSGRLLDLAGIRIGETLQQAQEGAGRSLLTSPALLPRHPREAPESLLLDAEDRVVLRRIDLQNQRLNALEIITLPDDTIVGIRRSITLPSWMRLSIADGLAEAVRKYGPASLPLVEDDRIGQYMSLTDASGAPIGPDREELAMGCLVEGDNGVRRAFYPDGNVARLLEAVPEDCGTLVMLQFSKFEREAGLVDHYHQTVLHLGAIRAHVAAHAAPPRL